MLFVVPTKPPGGTPRLMPHPVAGFEDCVSCHDLRGSGADYRINYLHECQQCHATSPRLPFAHDLVQNVSCPLCHIQG